MKTVDLHYELSGPQSGPPLLLAGSLGTAGAMWDPQVRTLSGRLRTVAFDHRGHGSSPVPRGPYEIADLGRDVLALMDRLKLRRVSFVGLSIGGMVGQWLAGNHPERIDKLVLIATSAHMGSPDPWLERAATVRAAGTTEVIVDTVMTRWFTPGWAKGHRQIIADLRGSFCSVPVEGYAACCEAIAQLDVRPELAEIQAPTLVISAAQDPAIPPEHQRYIADAVSDARLETIEEGAHLVSVQQPEAVSRLIAEHLEVKL